MAVNPALTVGDGRRASRSHPHLQTEGTEEVTYTPKPSTGALFKNERKEKDHQPDYKGTLCLPDGSTMQLGGWISQGAKGKYLSLKVSAFLPARGDPEDVT